MVNHMEFYTVDELKHIIVNSAKVLGVEIDDKGAYEMARRSRGTPRLANRLSKACQGLSRRSSMTAKSPMMWQALHWIFWKWTSTDLI